MKHPPSTPSERAQKVLFALLALAVALVLLLALFSRNAVTQTRAVDSYAAVADVTVTSLTHQTQCRFTLGQIGHSETLAFFLNHHEISVTIGGETVYTMTSAQDDVFRTSGGTWVTIPLLESDSGREVVVTLTPLYDDYQDRNGVPEFLVGSEIALHNVTLHRAMPALILSLCVMFAGFLLICLAVYHSFQGLSTGRLTALGLMAISAGLWRITYDRVAYLLLPDHAVLVFTVSILSLMGVALSMLNSLESDEKGRRLIRLTSVGYCLLYLVQLTLQLFGLADLRQSLKAVHVTIVLSAAAFVLSAARQFFTPKAQREKPGNFGWLLGLGVVIDLLLYYFASSTFHMVFTLVAILCYSILEGIQLLFRYIKQKNALEEMEIQLTLSRTATMMSQIRSHFVFNILNAISGMCKYDPEKADETVVRFARYLRGNIDIMENDRNIPFATDLKQVRDYVALEQVRFGDMIAFETDIQTEDFFIPPLIVQPVVENAIKHGLRKKLSGGTIRLATRDVGSAVLITVSDDGVGFDLAELDKESSVGIRNIRFRLEHLVHGSLDIQSTPGQGTTVTITIPKEGTPCASST